MGFNAGVVGHLVVTDEGGVSRRRAGKHVADKGVDIQFAQEDGRAAAHQGILEVAVVLIQTWLDVLAPLLPEAIALQDDIPEKEQQGAREVVGIGEIGVEVGGMEAGKILNGAGRVHDVRRIARQQVTPAGATIDQQPVAVGVILFDLGYFVRVTGGDDHLALAIVPTKGRNIVVVAVQQAGLAGRGLGREIGLPTDQFVVAFIEPAFHRRRVAQFHGLLQHWLGQAVDFQEENAGHIRLDHLLAAPDAFIDDVAVVRGVVVQGQQCAQDDVDGGDAQRGPNGRPKAVDVETRDNLRRQPDDNAVEDQEEQAAGEDGEG